MSGIAFAPVTPFSIATAAIGEAAFVVLLFAGSRYLPGRIQAGVLHGDGRQIAYRLNGLLLFALVLVAAAALQLWGPGLASLARNVWSLFIAANLLAIPVGIGLFLLGRRRERTGRGIDLFYGVERDPALFGVDLKMFSYRPSLIGLALINLSCASAQYEATGTLSAAMLLYQAFTLIYVLNYFEFEYGMVFTWDIIEERFGLMLVWGDYVLVPFFYALPAFYVAARTEPLDPVVAGVTIAVFGFGFWMFRGANEQKHRFKQDANVRIWGRPALALDGKLLVSGFWGIGRKLNYTGELAMYLAWCSLAGFGSFVPFLVPAWLGALLTHRALRDDRRCRAKYGDLWRVYCSRARFRMFPVVEGLIDRLRARAPVSR